MLYWIVEIGNVMWLFMLGVFFVGRFNVYVEIMVFVGKLVSILLVFCVVLKYFECLCLYVIVLLFFWWESVFFVWNFWLFLFVCIYFFLSLVVWFCCFWWSGVFFMVILYLVFELISWYWLWKIIVLCYVIVLVD